MDRILQERMCPMEKTTAILLFSCPDQKGIVAAVSGFIATP